MLCFICGDTGVVVKERGMGVYSFSPCHACRMPLVNKINAERELRELLNSPGVSKTRISRLPDGYERSPGDVAENGG